MNLEQKIMGELKTAMLAKDEKTVRSLRAIKAAIILAKTSEGAGGVIEEEEEIKLLQKLVKQRKDSLEIFEKQGREDLAEKEREEMAVIERFLPKQLDEAKGLITADFQNYLEKSWIDELRKKYPAKVNEAVLKTLWK